MSRRGHVPLRTCKVCGRKRGKDELLRWVLVGGAIRLDLEKRLPGRGAYTCPGPSCRQRIESSRKIHRRFLAALKGRR